MLKYISYRLIGAIPVIFVVSILAFVLSTKTPGDPVLEKLAGGQDDLKLEQGLTESRKEYQRVAQQMGTNLPIFYVDILPGVLPDTLLNIVQKEERKNFKTLAYKSGDWTAVNNYRKSILQLGDYPFFGDSSLNDVIRIRNLSSYLLINSDPGAVTSWMAQLEATAYNLKNEGLNNAISELHDAHQQMLKSRPSFFGWIPRLRWNGLSNRYHQWIKGVLKGDFGVSVRDGLPVGEKIWTALKWTLLVNTIALVLAFGLGIWLGIWSKRNDGKRRESWIRNFLFFLFAMPSFWLATLLIVFLTSPEFGSWLDIFPSRGLGNYQWKSGWFNQMGTIAYHLVLPVISLSSGALAYLSRQMKSGILKEWKEQYVKVLQAKGFDDEFILKKHVIRNSIFPLITILGGSIPALISGSLIIEVIFSIPGMGRLTLNSILSQDWAVVYSIVLLVAMITILGYIITDVLYRYLDPRIRFQNVVS